MRVRVAVFAVALCLLRGRKFLSKNPAFMRTL